MKSRTHLDDEFGSRCDSENHACPAQVSLIGILSCVLEDPLRRNQCEELSGVSRRNRRRRHPELHRIERDRVEITTTLGIRHVRSGRIGIVIILDQPSMRWNVRKTVRRRDDVAPEAK